MIYEWFQKILSVTFARSKRASTDGCKQKLLGIVDDKRVSFFQLYLEYVNKKYYLEGLKGEYSSLANIYLFKVNNRNTKKGVKFVQS